MPCLAVVLHIFFAKIVPIFLSGPSYDSFHAADVQCDPVILSSILPAPLVSSPYLDANEEIHPQVTGSPGCWSLHLY